MTTVLDDSESDAATVGGRAEGRLARRITARDIMATFFAYYWRNDAAIEVPGTFLVSVLADFDVAAPNARATLRRLERDDLLETRKAGRNLFFRAAPPTRSRAEPGVRRILNFGLTDDWSGVWTVVAFSVPEQQSRIRMALRDSLRLEGFAPFYDGVWIAPGDLREVAVTKADVRGVEQLSAHLVEDSSFMVRGRQPIESWDLEGINAAYAIVLDEAEELAAQFAAGDLSPAAALVKRTLLLTRYRRLVPLDPGLPLSLMPEGWLRREARDSVARVFDALGPLAVFRFEQLLDGIDEVWAERVREAALRTLDELAAMSPGDQDLLTR
ncbi:PaaX family transcriptional regulator [Microbacterium sp. A196]|uniref:PaaX family transcriptional regulator n=1 Tax=unclassified Microbacterium TaxID=2609290 RepID=UPI003F2FE079